MDLIHSIINGDLEDHLIKNFDEMCISEQKKNEAIIYASKFNRLKILELLLKDQSVDPNVYDSEAIRWASSMGHLEIVERLLKDPRIDPSLKDNDAIRTAANSGHLEIVKRLLKDSRVDPSALDSQALRSAATKNYILIVKLLLEDSRSDPCAKQYQAYWYSKGNGHNEISDLLIDTILKIKWKNIWKLEARKYINNWLLKPDTSDGRLGIHVRVCTKRWANYFEIKN